MRHFTEENLQMKKSEHNEKMFSIIIIREMKIKATMKYHDSKGLKLKIVATPNAGNDVEKLHRSFIAGGSINWCSHARKWFCTYLKALTCYYHKIQQLCP